jgi:SAM-dependent methyltransferase
MTEPRQAGGYDQFAWLYDRRWGEISLAFVPALERLVLDALPAGSHVLDLACGTGQLAALLAERGFEVTGLDSSAGMLAIARARAPSTRFVQADARTFELPDRFDAVVSVFDSLNHIVSMDELRAVFGRVKNVLVSGGSFVFDLNTVDAVASGHSETLVGEDHVAVIRTRFDPPRRVLTFEAIIFRSRGRLWERSDVRLLQRCHDDEEVRHALIEAGFIDVDVTSSEALGHRPGRLFYEARVPR